MRYGTDRVIECPHCNFRVRITSIASANTLGRRIWLDGETQCPMYPRLKLLTICTSCNQFYWLKDANVIEQPENSKAISCSLSLSSMIFLFISLVLLELDTFSPYTLFGTVIFLFAWIWYEDRWLRYRKKLPKASTLSLSQVEEALNKKTWDTDQQEVELRIFFWRRSNDKYRNKTNINLPRSNEEVANMNTLLEILRDDVVQERVLKIEIVRELGEFSKAEYLLNIKLPNQTVDDFYFQWIELIGEYVQKRDSNIHEIFLKERVPHLLKIRIANLNE